MSSFTQAIKWLREEKKVRRPNWDENSYWKLSQDKYQKIIWSDGTHARIHLEQIEAKDWEVFVETCDPFNWELKHMGKKVVDENGSVGKFTGRCETPSFTIDYDNGHRLTAGIDSLLGKGWKLCDEVIK